MKSNDSPGYLAVRRQHLESVALHEISHAFVELRRSEGIRITLRIDPRYPIQRHSKTWDGRAEVMVLNKDAFQDSVNGWAGLMGEAIEQNYSEALELTVEKYRVQRESISDTDLALIESIPVSRRSESAKSAYDLLMESWSDVKNVQSRAVKFIEENHLDQLVFGWMKTEGWVGIEADK